MTTGFHVLEKWIFRGVLFCVIVLGIGYNIVTPPWQFPDEYGHFDYVRFVQSHRQLPSYEFRTDSWEYHQPPLYYLVQAATTWPFLSLSIPAQMFVSRVISLLIGLVSIAAARAFLKKLLSDDPWSVTFGTALFALLPMNLYMMSGVNNDVIANLFGVLILLALILLERKRSVSDREVLIFGAVLGLSLLTKVTLYPMSFAIFIFALVILWQRRSFTVKRGFLFCAPILLIAGGWWVWNIATVGHPLGWSNIYAFSDLMKRESWLNAKGVWDWISTWSLSTVGRFDYFNIALAFNSGYALFGLIFFVGLVGQWWAWKDASRGGRRWLVLLYAFVLLAAAEVFTYSLTVYQPQGRYGLVALSGMVVFLATGWRAFVRWWMTAMQWIVLGIIVGFLLFVNLYQIRTMHWIYGPRVAKQYKLDEEYLHNKWVSPQKLVMLPSPQGFIFDLIPEFPSVKSAFSLNRFYSDEIQSIHVELVAPAAGEVCLTWRTTFEREFGRRDEQCLEYPQGASTAEFAWKKQPYPVVLGELQLRFPSTWERVQLKSVRVRVDPNLHWLFRQPRWD